MTLWDSATSQRYYFNIDSEDHNPNPDPNPNPNPSVASGSHGGSTGSSLAGLGPDSRANSGQDLLGVAVG